MNMRMDSRQGITLNGRSATLGQERRLDMHVGSGEFNLSNRVVHALNGAGIHLIGELIQQTEARLLGPMTPDFSHKGLAEVKGMLKRFGFGLATTLAGWPPKEAGGALVMLDGKPASEEADPD